eukprot:2206000-Amphidinium_carterae.1
MSKSIHDIGQFLHSQKAVHPTEAAAPLALTWGVFPRCWVREAARPQQQKKRRKSQSARKRKVARRFIAELET